MVEIRNKYIDRYSEGSIESAFALSLKNIINFGDTDIFPFPYETRMFEDIFDNMVESLVETHNNFNERLNDCPPVNISTCSTLGYSGYRWVTQIDPYWNAYYLGLVLAICSEIEMQRVSDDVVYSYRYSPDINSGSLFSKEVNWRKFQADSLSLADLNDSINYVVTCDIADFYTRIYHHRLENALDRVDESGNVSGKIKKMIQSFSDTNSYGLPVGGAAARVLAELSLDSLDHLLTINNVLFKRYVDDFIIFCSSKEEAHSILTFISRKLMENEGLTLQKYKTNILSKEEFVTLTRSKLYGLDEDEESPMKAKFMSLPIRFDPYSANAEEQYDSIKDSLKDFDLLGMLSKELQKSKINQPFSKQLLRAFSAIDDEAVCNAFKVIYENLTELYPIFSTVVQVTISNWFRFDFDTKSLIKDRMIRLVKEESFILETELNLSYVVKLFAKENSIENQSILADIYKKNSDSILIALTVNQVMSKWGVHYWLSEFRRIFPTMNPWQRRLFIVSSYLLGDEGSHWRAHNKSKFSFIEIIYRDWASKRKQNGTIKEAL